MITSIFRKFFLCRRSTKSDEPLQQLRFKNDITDGFDLFSGYKVLTPTMYRSRMAAARQAVSMDCYYSYQGKSIYFPHKVFILQLSISYKSKIL